MTAADFQAYAAKQFPQVDPKLWTRSSSRPAAE
jgi:hypothetical protein